MKKILCFILTTAMLFALTACTVETSTSSNTEVNINNGKTTTNMPSTTANSEQNNTNTTAPNIAEQKGKITIEQDEEYDILKADAKYSGLYRLASYSITTIGNKTSFIANLEGVNIDNIGMVDLSKANITHICKEYNEFIYIKLTLDGKEIADWDIVDRRSNKSVYHLSETELLKKYCPENTYETIEKGSLPEKIKLSDYEAQKTYIFETEEDFTPPEFENNTKYTLLVVSTKNSSSDKWTREFYSQHQYDNASFRFASSSDKKFYFSFAEATVDDVIASEKAVVLKDCKAGENIEMQFKEYIVNKTGKTIVIKISDFGREETFTIKDGEVLCASWMGIKIVVEEIK